MEGLSVASNIIAAVDLSTKVASLCLQYSKLIKNDKVDIDQLHREATNLKAVSKNAQKLLNSPNRRRLESSQELIVAVEDSLSTLQRLEQDLNVMEQLARR
ncbi:hypothetical protein EDB80DRAFT_874790 [Ilyonectria destructans]|nr:hypothetical protein EDB80DRAFT_874790 [Ilyonectria destructans]